jgi:hypothetical protein
MVHDYLDKIREVLEFEGFYEVISEIFFTTSEIFFTNTTLDISLTVKYNFIKTQRRLGHEEEAIRTNGH